MRNTNSTNNISDNAVGKAVFKNAVPSMIAMMMLMIYNLADIFFIGQTHNDFMVAAVSLATPVFLIFMALGTLFGMGGTSVISRAMGEGRIEYAKKVCSFCMWSCIAIGIIGMLFFWIFMDELLLILGASSNTIEYTRDYLNIVVGCGVFSMISNCYSNIIRAEGKSATAMTGSLLGNVLNVVLDPIMIFVLDMGIVGAAVATVIGNVIAALYYFVYFWRGKSSLSIHIRHFSVRDKIAWNVLIIGLPAALANFLMSFSQIMVNSRIALYGDMEVAAYGVASKVMLIISSISVGLGQGVQPLLGYCYGAKDKERFMACLKFSAKMALTLCAAMAALVIIFTEPVVKIFLTDKNALEYGIRFTRIIFLADWIFGIISIFMNAMQAMGAAAPSLIASACRQGIIFIPAVLLMDIWIGIDGIIWAQPVADVVTLILTSALLYVALKREHFIERK
ncbi:MAG: MATE family efflux transporter [Blautia sp.]